MADDVIHDSFPEELLASQWLDRCAPDFFDVPERRLLVAVLVDAVRRLRSGGVKDHTAVIAWLRGKDARVPFQALCEGLALDPPRIARRLLQDWGPSQIPRRGRTGSLRKIQCVGQRQRRVDPAQPAEVAEEPRSISA